MRSNRSTAIRGSQPATGIKRQGATSNPSSAAVPMQMASLTVWPGKLPSHAFTMWLEGAVP